MYVGRSFHNGDMLVAKVLPSKHAAFVSWRGQEISKDHFEVLCGQNLAWVHCYEHEIPDNAISCGTTALGQPVYVGRGHFEGSLTVGKVSSVHRALFIPFNGVERRLESYEILVAEDAKVGWCDSSSEDIKPIVKLEPYTPMTSAVPLSRRPVLPPYPAEVAPMPSAPYDPPPAYSTMPMPMPSPMPMLPPKPMPIPMPLPMPMPSTDPYPPPPPPQSHHMHNPARGSDLWVSAGSSYVPANAVTAGHDTDMSTIYVCRAFHEGELVPGKALPSRSCAYVSYAGSEIPKSNYEILVGSDYHWVPAHDGNIAPAAIEGGRTSSGEILFVGRAHYCGSLTPGKIQRSHQCLYIAFGGAERRVTNYEVLVRREEYYRKQNQDMHY